MPDQKAWLFDDFEVDLRAWRLSKAGVPIGLEPKALELLALLIERPGEVVSKAEILDRVWKDTAVTENAMVRVIAQIRTALGDDAKSPRYLETVHTRGYRFVASVAPAPSAPPPGQPAAASGPRRRRPGLLVIAAAMGVIVVAVFAWNGLRGDAPARGAAADRSGPAASIAILPLENLGPPAEQYFADGMTEAITTQLSKIEAVRVIARGAVLQYQSGRPPPAEIARVLGVTNLVEGSALLTNDRVRITARLVDGSTNETVWGESYEGDLVDILALQARVARAIAREIRVRVTSDEERRLQRTPAVSAAAYQEYLRGLYEIEQGRAFDSNLFAHMRQALDRFGKAVEIEPGWGEAHGIRAYTHLNLAGLSDDPIERQQQYKLARRAAERSLELDPSVVRARLTLARTLFVLDGDWDGAERELREVLRLEPNNADWSSGMFFIYAGQFDEGIGLLRHALERFPTSVATRYQLGLACICAKRYDEAAEQATTLRGSLKDEVHAPLLEAKILAARGQYADAVNLLDSRRAALMVNRTTTYLFTLAWAAARAGDTGRARKALAELEALGNPEPPQILFALGARDEAVRLLQEARARRDFSLMMLRCAPEFDNMRKLPEVAKILRDIRMPNLD